MISARSLLFAPGNRQRFVEKALASEADAVIFDLEDSVPPAEKQHARALVSSALAQPSAKHLWVRINALGSGDFEADLAMFAGQSSLSGFWLPKVDEANDVVAVANRLTEIERVRESCVPAQLIATIESARGVWNAFAICNASPRLLTVCFASARDGDLMRDLGCDWNDGTGLHHSRAHVLLAARAAGVELPLDGVFADLTDTKGFARDTEFSKGLGYRGRTVVHPSQIALANEIYQVSAVELNACREIIKTYNQALSQGRGSALYRGRMIDAAMVVAAQKQLKKAAIP